MSTSLDLTNALEAKLIELDNKLNEVEVLKQSLIDANLSQLAARVQTLENGKNETNADVQALQALFNTDHYEVIPALVSANASKEAAIALLNEKVNIINAFINALKELN